MKNAMSRIDSSFALREVLQDKYAVWTRVGSGSKLLRPKDGIFCY